MNGKSKAFVNSDLEEVNVEYCMKQFDLHFLNRQMYSLSDINIRKGDDKSFLHKVIFLSILYPNISTRTTYA